MSENSNGSYRITLERQFKAYDSLPKNIREALANADYDYAVPPVKTLYKKMFGRLDELIADIKEWDRSYKSRKNLERIWGKGYPL